MNLEDFKIKNKYKMNFLMKTILLLKITLASDLQNILFEYKSSDS